MNCFGFFCLLLTTETLVRKKTVSSQISPQLCAIEIQVFWGFLVKQERKHRAKSVLGSSSQILRRRPVKWGRNGQRQLCVCHNNLENMKMNFNSLLIGKGFPNSLYLKSFSAFFPLLFIYPTSLGPVLKQVTCIIYIYIFYYSFMYMKSLIYFSVLWSQNKTAAVLHLGPGDCCKEKCSDPAELLFKEG